MLQGYKTLIINLGSAVGLAVLTWGAGVDWTLYVSPTNAMLITFGVNTVLRWFTKTPVGGNA